MTRNRQTNEKGMDRNGQKQTETDKNGKKQKV